MKFLINTTLLIYIYLNQPFASPLCNELFHTASIFKMLENNSFNVNRTLTEYNQHFGGKLRPLLQTFTSDKVWIDMGAGNASAQIAYLSHAQNNGYQQAKCLAVAYKRPSNSDLSIYPTMQYKVGLQTPKTIAKLPKADLITDVMGIYTYTNGSARYDIIQSYIKLLKPGGKLMIFSYGNSDKSIIENVLKSKEMIQNKITCYNCGLVFTKNN